MALTPGGARTLLLALSDFWTAYFRDQTALTAYAEGLSLNVAQLYQNVLEAALGQSLAEAPLFDRTFFRAYTVRTDQVMYREGATPDDDTWVWSTGDGYVGAAFLANRLFAPTALLVEGHDYASAPGAIAFRADPFDPPPSYFPLRTVRVLAPATWTDPLGRAWTGVRTGDVLRVRVGGAEASTVITGVAGRTLYLAAYPTLLATDLTRRSPEVTVLRVPHNASQVGEFLSDHPVRVSRLTTATDDATCVTGTVEVSVAAEPSYTGAWAAGTAYSAGALVDQGGRVWQALSAHTSGGVFAPALWDDLATGYVHVEDPTWPAHDGLFRLTLPSAPGRLALAVLAPFAAATRVRLYRTVYTTASGDRPRVALPHPEVAPASLTIQAWRVAPRRIVELDGTLRTYPAGEPVVVDVDYRLDATTGEIVVLSPWNATRPARASYTWSLVVARRAHTWRGTLTPGASYAEGDVVLAAGTAYVVRTAHIATGLVDANYVVWAAPVATEVARDVDELAVWALDALVDEHRLAAVFGDLLGFDRPSSEPYRALLRGVARLFLLGPTFGLFESALNVLAGFAVVRDDDEILRAYISGIDASGTGQAFGQAEGFDGVFTAATSRFATATGTFLPSDVGAQLRVNSTAYTITAVLSPTLVEVAPPPPADATGQAWYFTHLVVRDRLRVTGYIFVPEDVGGWIRLASTAHAHNVGTFQIRALDDPLTAVLDTTYGLWDETGLAWEFSRTGVQTVQTDRQTYLFDLATPVRADVRLAASVDVLTFAAFEALTTAFRVVDYLEDPAWWHRITVPREFFDATGARRSVTPQLVEHVFAALDDGAYGDPGLAYGADEEGRTSTARAGPANWFGGSYVVLAWPAGTPGPRPRDVGTYLQITTPRFAGHYPIVHLEADGITLKLGQFPPPEASSIVPPVPLAVALAPLVYRRVVAFVVFDRFLKYHSVQLVVDPAIALTGVLLADALQVLRNAVPSHVFVFVETPTTFRDTAAVTDTLLLGVTYTLQELVASPLNMVQYLPSGLLRHDDWYHFIDSVTNVPAAPGTYALPIVLPPDPTAVRSLVGVALQADATVGARRPAEGVDYDVDYVAGTLTIRPGVALLPNPVKVYYVDCVRVIHPPPGPYAPGETSLVYGGADPTLVRAPSELPGDAGVLDRAVQLTLGP